jgi:hypothetical protein
VRLVSGSFWAGWRIDAGYGKDGRCGVIIGSSVWAKAGEVIDIRSNYSKEDFSLDVHQINSSDMHVRFTRSASPFFLGGVSSRGRLSINRTNVLHSSGEKKF